MKSRSKLFTIWKKSDGLCVYCGTDADHADHVIPRTKGGTNEDTNLVAACSTCNIRKRNRSVEEFRIYITMRNAGILTAKTSDYATIVELGAHLPLVEFAREDVIASCNSSEGALHAEIA